MLHKETEVRLQELVKEWCDQGKRFTAYDVTQQLRTENFWVKHEDSKAEVHRIYEAGEMSDYDRELVDKAGNGVPAWEYFPEQNGTQPTNSNSAQATLPNHLAPSTARTYGSTAATPAAAAPSGGQAAVDDRQIVKNVDRRGTACVPARMIRELDVKPGDKVWIVVQPQARRVLVYSQRPSKPLKYYTVDKHNNVRITKGTQRAADIYSTTCRITLNSDSISLTQP